MAIIAVITDIEHGLTVGDWVTRGEIPEYQAEYVVIGATDNTITVRLPTRWERVKHAGSLWGQRVRGFVMEQLDGND